MTSRTRNLLLGCLGVGCLGALAALVLLPILVVRVARPMIEDMPTVPAIAIPTAATDATSVCDEAAVEAYIRDSSEQLNEAAALFSGLESPDQLRDLDLGRLEEHRDAHAALETPACLESIHEAEMELAAFALDTLEQAQSAGDRSLLELMGMGASLASGVAQRMQAIDTAWAEFGRGHGIDVTRLRQRYAAPATR